MKVKALIPHCNGYGDQFEKAEGDVYDMPDEHAGPLIAAGLAVKYAAAARPAGKRNGADG